APDPSYSARPEPPASVEQMLIPGMPSSAPPLAVPVPTLPNPASTAIATSTDAELTLNTMLRTLDRVTGKVTLSPVERAFIAGAKFMFDQLSIECDKMLTRELPDIAHSTAAPADEPPSTGTRPSQKTPKPKRTSPRTARKGPKGTKQTPPPKA